jgi:hypothetical protein
MGARLVTVCHNIVYFLIDSRLPVYMGASWRRDHGGRGWLDEVSEKIATEDT